MPLIKKKQEIDTTETPEKEIPEDELEQQVEEVPEEENVGDENQTMEEEPEQPEDGTELIEPEQDIPDVEPEVIDNDFKNIKLYDLFHSLYKYMSYFLSTYDDIEMDMISEADYNRIIEIYKAIKKYKDDIYFYMIHEFEDNDYNKNIYSYLLFNKGFAENVIKFRNILKLTGNLDKDSK